MNIHPHRTWITPLVIGAFLLSAVTGVLMFFHLNVGMNKLAHEWLSWALLTGVAAHVLLHKQAFFRYFKTRTGQAIVLGFAVLLGLSFMQIGKKPEPPYFSVIQALSRAPLTALAQVSGLSYEQLTARLKQQGIAAHSPDDNLASLMGDDTRKQIGILNKLLAK